MNKKRFWDIIEASRIGFDPKQYTESREKQISQLHQLLSSLSIKELRAFEKAFSARMDEAYSPPEEGLWAVASDIGGGCSEDGFDDFRIWLISMGREVYEAAIRNPETVYQVVEQAGLGDDAFFEEFQYVASRILDEKTGDED
jgi:hypothetical protein